VCRSPYAAEVFRRLLPVTTPAHCQSAGFIGPGRQPPTDALAAALRRSIDLHAHRSQIVSHALVRDADLIVVMSADQERALRERFGRQRAHLVVLGDLDPMPIRRRTVVDPWGREEHVFDECYARIDRCVRELARVVNAAPPSVSVERPVAR
jgi:protein-tyrosine-phosphatase